jgi:hypothetical protein
MIKRTLFLLFLAVFPLIQVFGQSEKTDSARPKDDNQKKNISIFGSDELLNISITMDLTGFMKKTNKEASFDGMLIFNPGETDSLSRRVVLKYRGEYRYEICSFPPMQINFKKTVHSYADTGKIKKLKLVTRCMQNNIYDEYTLREFLVYKLYNVLTDTSFRVRLVKLTYYDTRKNNRPVSQYGFFIEPLNIVAARINSDIVKSVNLTQVHIVPEVIDRVAIFNYMISNWDWSVPGRHNVDVLKPRKLDASGLGLSVPFDFDLCGVVNADYSIPAEVTGLKNARDRRYTGICRTREVFETDLKSFLAKKDKLYSVINDFQYLNEKSKKDIINFLDEFFVRIEKEKSLNSLVTEFVNNCKKL